MKRTQNNLVFGIILIALITVIVMSMHSASVYADSEGVGLSPPWIKNHMYAKVAVVDSIDEENDIAYMAIPFKDGVFLYAWQGIEDNEVGDVVGMLMYDNDTSYIMDDVILSITYSGWNAAELLGK